MLINTFDNSNAALNTASNAASKIEDCSICYETKILIKLDCCSHSFCSDCLISQENNKCALCRQQFSLNDFIMKERKEKVYETSLRNKCKLPTELIERMKSYSKLASWIHVDDSHYIQKVFKQDESKLRGFKDYNSRLFICKTENGPQYVMIVDKEFPNKYFLRSVIRR